MATATDLTADNDSSPTKKAAGKTSKPSRGDRRDSVSKTENAANSEDTSKLADSAKGDSRDARAGRVEGEAKRLAKIKRDAADKRARQSKAEPTAEPRAAGDQPKPSSRAPASAASKKSSGSGAGSNGDGQSAGKQTTSTSGTRRRTPSNATVAAATDVDRLAGPLVGDDDPDESAPRRRFLIFQATPAWLVSMLFHVLLVLALGLVTLADPVQIVNVLSATGSADEGPEIEEFSIEQMDPGEMPEMEEFTEPVEMTELVEMTEPMEVDVPMDVAAVPLEMADFATEMAPAAATLQTLSSSQMSQMSGRSSEMKKKMLREFGGNAASEAAVTEALKWFALHQAPNGSWTLAHNLICRNQCGDPGDERHIAAINGATALALLPFLGAGQTHYDGEFKNVVRRGLLYLIQNGKPGTKMGMPVLDFSERSGNMYSHGLTAIVLCEAYAMTEDPALAMPAQQALNYIAAAQGRDGGWRYKYQSEQGDTSVVGWQLMALKSGHMGHLIVPPQTIRGSLRFLDKVQSDGGSQYGYDDPGKNFNASCTAVGLLCRMYTGWDKTHPELQEGVQKLANKGVIKRDIYYNYYAAQVLRHVGGPEWDKFNTELRDWLVETQAQEGGEKGSWHFPAGHTGRAGGRLAITSFATMILEVYYRHMPLYADSGEEDEFPL